MNDTITLRFEDGSTSTVPRFRIDKEFIQSAVNRVTARKAASKPKVFKSKLFSVKDSTKDSTTKLPFRSPALMFSHLLHRDSNTIILADAELKTKCSTNVTYDVVAMAPIAIKDSGVLSAGESRSSILPNLSPVSSHQTESHYDGDVLYIVHDVPITTQNGRFEVTENDVKIWIVSGGTSALENVDVLTKKIKSLKETLLQIEQELASLPPAPIPSGRGRVTAGSSAKSARDKKVKILSDEKERCTSLLSTAKRSLETLYAQHMVDCKLIVEKRSRDGALDNKSCDWAIQVDGDKKEMYTSLIENNKNWSIPMYAFGVKGGKTPISLPIPEEDQSTHFVDIKCITMSKLPHGFGILESYAEFDPYLNSDKKMSRHRLYHGHFHEGEFSEGALYTEAGIFTGKFDKGRPTIGTKKYADGIEITGEFAVHDLSLQTITNPYCRGLSDGFQSIKFPDKATYQGVMKQGRITGKGTYKYAGKELSGEFKDGVLQVGGGNEGQGCSNLHLSCMHGGERLWGP